MWSGIWSVATTWIGFWTWIWSTRHCGLGQEVACWFWCWKTQLVSFDQSNNTGAIDVKMDVSVLEEKSFFNMLRLTFSFKLDWALTLSLLLKLPPRKLKLELWFVLWNFFLLRLLCIYKSTIQPFMEYCYQVWAGAPNCHLELLDKLQKQICRIVGPWLAASPEPLTHLW